MILSGNNAIALTSFLAATTVGLKTGWAIGTSLVKASSKIWKSQLETLIYSSGSKSLGVADKVVGGAGLLAISSVAWTASVLAGSFAAVLTERAIKKVGKITIGFFLKTTDQDNRVKMLSIEEKAKGEPNDTPNSPKKSIYKRALPFVASVVKDAEQTVFIVTEIVGMAAMPCLVGWKACMEFIPVSQLIPPIYDAVKKYPAVTNGTGEVIKSLTNHLSSLVLITGIGISVLLGGAAYGFVAGGIIKFPRRLITPLNGKLLSYYMDSSNL